MAVPPLVVSYCFPYLIFSLPIQSKSRNIWCTVSFSSLQSSLVLGIKSMPLILCMLDSIHFLCMFELRKIVSSPVGTVTGSFLIKCDFCCFILEVCSVLYHVLLYLCLITGSHIVLEMPALSPTMVRKWHTIWLCTFFFWEWNLVLYILAWIYCYIGYSSFRLNAKGRFMWFSVESRQHCKVEEERRR